MGHGETSWIFSPTAPGKKEGAFEAQAATAEIFPRTHHCVAYSQRVKLPLARTPASFLPASVAPRPVTYLSQNGLNTMQARIGLVRVGTIKDDRRETSHESRLY